MSVKAKARLRKGKLKVKVKYPLVGRADLEIGSISKMKAVVKIPFLFSAKLLGIFRKKKRRK